MPRLRNALLALGLVIGWVVGLPAAASAHDVLERTNPADGTTVATLPGAVELTFSDDPVAVGTQVLVRGPAGNVESGAAVIEGRTVRQAIDPHAPAGDYTVTYRVTAGDGHPVTGTFVFFATVGLDGSTATAGPTVHVKAVGTSEGDSSSALVPVLLTVAGTVVLLAIGGFVVLRGRPRQRS